MTEKETGRVRRVQNGVLSGTIVLDLNVSTDSERGLLGLELHPNFPATPFVYLYYSATTGSDGGAVARQPPVALHLEWERRSAPRSCS